MLPGRLPVFWLEGPVYMATGVLPFAGLTAYDPQKVVRMASEPASQAGDSDLMRKLSVQGALSVS